MSMCARVCVCVCGWIDCVGWAGILLSIQTYILDDLAIPIPVIAVFQSIKDNIAYLLNQKALNYRQPIMLASYTPGVCVRIIIIFKKFFYMFF